MFKVQWCEWAKIINKTFIPLVDNTDRYLILWGGRGSSKSDFAAKKLIYRCLSEDYFRFILVRNEYNKIKDSQYQTIKDIIIDLGLAELFEFKVQPLEIVCKNGNKFIARGCDDAKKLKSIKDPTGAWYEEEIPNEDDFITITTSIRTTKAAYLQEIFTINPEVDGDYNDHWFFKRFISSRYPEETTFRDVTTVEYKDGDDVVSVDMAYTSHQSTYKDNRWIPKSFIAQLHELKANNPYYYTIYCIGLWGNKQLGGLFYKLFDRSSNTGKYKYNPELPIHLSVDFNVNPGMHALLGQVILEKDKKRLYIFGEILTKSPDNTSFGVCNEFERRFMSHTGGLYVYGDSTGKKEDTRSEKGFNDFVLIENELRKYRPIRRVPKLNPPVHNRGQFINSVFENNFDGIEVVIDESCYNLINDLQNVKEAADGTKHKEKTKDKDLNVPYEKWGHMSDCFDYLICEAFSSSFAKYISGSVVHKPTIGRRTINTSSSY